MKEPVTTDIRRRYKFNWNALEGNRENMTKASSPVVAIMVVIKAAKLNVR
jgi:hypothetical protein